MRAEGRSPPPLARFIYFAPGVSREGTHHTATARDSRNSSPEGEAEAAGTGSLFGRAQSSFHEGQGRKRTTFPRRPWELSPPAPPQARAPKSELDGCPRITGHGWDRGAVSSWAKGGGETPEGSERGDRRNPLLKDPCSPLCCLGQREGNRGRDSLRRCRERGRVSARGDGAGPEVGRAGGRGLGCACGGYDPDLRGPLLFQAPAAAPAAPSPTACQSVSLGGRVGGRGAAERPASPRQFPRLGRRGRCPSRSLPDALRGGRGARSPVSSRAAACSACPASAIAAMGDGAGGDMNSNLPCAPYHTGDPQLDTAVGQWLRWDKNPKTKEQIENLLRNGMNKELRDRLCCRMTFGTAGLRSAMGAGFCYINDLTVIQSTQGMYKYLERCFSDLKQRGFVVGYDTRGQVTSSCSSQRLAKLTAAVLLSKGVPVYLFSRYVPTPFVPYAVQELKAVAGVMITASHNRKEDNGYKVYWETGAQITSPHDKEILKCIEESVEPWIDSWNENLVDTSPLKRDPLQDICTRYMEDLKKICFHRELNSQTNLKFVHTSFHGVGHDYVQLAFKVFGFKPPIPVPEQQDPDPDFSTVKCPNPEEGESVLELSLRLAEKENARVVVATDPDADRLAVAELQGDGRWKVFTGNELAALFGWWMFDCWKENKSQNADVKNIYMLATTVSSKILKAIAHKEGFQFEETLPGFKWIGSRIKELLENGKEVLFAFEESIGFLCGTFVLDKDGVSAAVVVAEMAAYLETRNLTLAQQLTKVYERYGYHISKTSYFLCYDPPTIKNIFERLRNFHSPKEYPKYCGTFDILHIRDITTGYDSSQLNQKSVLPVSKSSQMITFTFQNGCVATLRTSGTEPKIKYYAEMCASPDQSDIALLEEELKKLVDALIENFLEPSKNGLIWRSA